MIHARALTLLTLSLSLIGCGPLTTDSDGDEALETSAQAVTMTSTDPTYTSASNPAAAQTQPRLAVWTNGNDPVFFWKPSTQSALLSLSKAALTNAGGQLASTALTGSASGNDLLKYVVGCALPPGATVSGPGGATYEGAIGLAPEWATGALATTSSQRWMTACLVQTLNALGAHVPIQLSGDNDALADAPYPDYGVLDATTFGNIFIPLGRAYACTDLSLVNACTLQVSLNTLFRICGLSPTCGLTLLGPCAVACPGGGACNAPLARGYEENITSSLPATIAVSLNPLCDLL